MIRDEDFFITGGNGMLASYFPLARRVSHRELDVTDAESVRYAINKGRPRVVIHLAAITDMKRAENDPFEVFRVNTAGALNVARAAREAGARFVFMSTNAVFDARSDGPFSEKDAPNARTHYGRSKHAAEAIVRRVVPESLIVRTSWLFGGGRERDQKFVGIIMSQLASGAHEINAAVDSIGSPTYARDVARFITDAVNRNDRSALHVVNEGAVSRYELAREIVRAIGARASVVPVSVSTFNSLESRGNHALHSTRSRLRPWKDALSEYLREEWPGAFSDIS